MRKKFYIAYGCNMDREGMARRCPDCEFIDIGYLLDYELIFKGCASIRKLKDSKVPVAIYLISKSDEKYLDMMEGYPNYYDKIEVEVDSFNNGKLKGKIYIMNENYPEGTPSRWYFNGIKDSYRDFGFDEDILNKAYRIARDLTKNNNYVVLDED